MSDDVREVRLPQEQIESVILELCHKRGVGKTICPSEAALAIVSQNGDWRGLMADVRIVGFKMSNNGQIEITQKGQVVDLETTKGPIRFGLLRG